VEEEALLAAEELENKLGSERSHHATNHEQRVGPRPQVCVGAFNALHVVALFVDFGFQTVQAELLFLEILLLGRVCFFIQLLKAGGKLLVFSALLLSRIHALRQSISLYELIHFGSELGQTLGI